MVAKNLDENPDKPFYKIINFNFMSPILYEAYGEKVFSENLVRLYGNKDDVIESLYENTSEVELQTFFDSLFYLYDNVFSTKCPNRISPPGPDRGEIESSCLVLWDLGTLESPLYTDENRYTTVVKDAVSRLLLHSSNLACCQSILLLLSDLDGSCFSKELAARFLDSKKCWPDIYPAEYLPMLESWVCEIVDNT